MLRTKEESKKCRGCNKDFFRLKVGLCRKCSVNPAVINGITKLVLAPLEDEVEPQKAVSRRSVIGWREYLRSLTKPTSTETSTKVAWIDLITARQNYASSMTARNAELLQKANKAYTAACLSGIK